MSNTYKHKKFGYYNSLRRKKACTSSKWEAYAYAWDEYHRNPKYGRLFRYDFYSHNPGWWNNYFSTRPSRTRQRNILNKITVDNCEDDWDFPDYKKPHIYYW